MILYKIGGLGADERVFEKLSLNAPTITIKWLNPLHSKESLEDYVLRISKQIDQTKKFGIIGVSFGGIIAIELSKILKPATIILVSSIPNSQELPFKILRLPLSKLINLIPNRLIKPPQFIMNFMFSAVDKDLLAKIIDDTDPSFIKWSLIKILTWNSMSVETKNLRIHGTKDRLIPLKGAALLVKSGGHFMIVDEADEVSDIINKYMFSSDWY